MALSRFDSLNPGAGDIWIDLVVVEAITPLLGAPVVPLGQSIDMGDIRVIGCRVVWGEHTCDIDACPNCLARRVSVAQSRLMLPADTVRVMH